MHSLLTSCDPVAIDTTKILSLLYVDDIVLLSNTAEGSQNAFYKIGGFFETWKLKVNILGQKSNGPLQTMDCKMPPVRPIFIDRI